MKKFFEWFTGLPYLMQFVIIAAVVLLVIYIHKRSQKILEKAKQQIQHHQEEKELAEVGQKPSYTVGVYRDMADKLEGAMKGLGTDIVSVFEVFGQMKNDLDVLNVEKEFGIRADANLSEWLHGEWQLSVTAINKVLRYRGIRKQF